MAQPGVRFVPLKQVDEASARVLPLVAMWAAKTRDAARDAVLKLLRTNLERYCQYA